MKKFVLLFYLIFTCIVAQSQVKVDTAYRDNYKNINEVVYSKKDSGNAVTPKKSAVIPPTFVGGRQALQLYLQANVKYPRIAIEKGIAGTVIVKFTVDSTGAIRNPKIARNVYYDLDVEALRVVSTLPDWNPATRDGKPISMDIAIPIEFRKK